MKSTKLKMGNPSVSDDALRQKVCPVCNVNVESRGLRARFNSRDDYGYMLTFCSWTHYQEFKNSHDLEDYIQ